MFSLFKRTPGKAQRVDDREVRSRMAEGRMEMEAMGRLPKDVAEAGLAHEPPPEYIAEAGDPSDEVWAREKALYREKNAEQ
ncbi:MAG: hypothetical protein ACRDPA_20100 [Solirubrobacteraceae bacterium]